MRDAARYLAHVVVVVVSLCRRYLPQPSHQEAIQLDGSRVESTLDRWHLADTTTRCARQQAASGQQQKASRPRRGRRLLLVAWLRRACVRHIGIAIGIGMARVALVASVTTGIEFVAEEELRARLAPRGGDAAAALQLARHPGKVSLSLPASEVRGGGGGDGPSRLTETVCQLDAMLEVRSLEKLHAVVAYAPELLAASAITAPPSASKAARDSKRRFNKKAANNRKEPRKASDDDATAAPAAAEPNEQQPEPPAAAPSERIPESDIQRANLERVRAPLTRARRHWFALLISVSVCVCVYV